MYSYLCGCLCVYVCGVCTLRKEREMVHYIETLNSHVTEIEPFKKYISKNSPRS